MSKVTVETKKQVIFADVLIRQKKKVSRRPSFCQFEFSAIFDNKVWISKKNHNNKKSKDLVFYGDLKFSFTFNVRL